MGNRANYGFRSNDDTLFLYGHWAGEPGMAERLASALNLAGPRRCDSSYATRITISQLIGDDWNSETGWGLYVNMLGDNENPVFVVDWKMQTVERYEHPDWMQTSEVINTIKENKPDQTWSLSEFVNGHAVAA